MALTALWTGKEPEQIGGMLADALLGTLGLVFVQVRLRDPLEGASFELLRVADALATERDIRESLATSTLDSRIDFPSGARLSLGNRDLYLRSVRLGLHGEIGIVIVGSERADFPSQTERLLLDVTTNQALVALQHAFVLGEQRRVAIKLEDHVAQGTRELAAANEELKKSEGNLRLIIDTIPAFVWCMLPDGRNEFISKGWHAHTGVTPEESRDWGWMSVFHPDDLPGLMNKWRDVLSGGEPDEIEARIRRSDGVYRWFLIRASPFRDESGTIVKWYGTSTDIEDLKRGEEELRRNDAFLTNAQRLSSTGSFSWSVETDDITFSEEACRIFELNRGSPITLDRIASRVHADDLQLFEERTEAARKSGEGLDYQFRLQMPDGSVKYLHTTSSETRGVNGRREYIGAIQDVTDRWLGQDALNKARSDLAHISRVTSLAALTASIAHEVNQPLSGILTNAGTCLRMLDAHPPDVDGARETARRTIRDSNRATDVVARLRALFSRGGFTPEPIDLNEVAREVINLSRIDFQRERVSVQTDLADDVPSITADRVQLQQVILNLLRNAADAMSAVHDRPRRVLVRTGREPDGNVRLSVEDTGIGLADHNIDKIFESFYSTKSGGMGIGLSVSRSIIERHRGRLWAEANEGPGARFSFSIPGGSEIDA